MATLHIDSERLARIFGDPAAAGLDDRPDLFRAIAVAQHRATHEPSRSVSALRVGIAIAARCIGVGVMLVCTAYAVALWVLP